MPVRLFLGLNSHELGAWPDGDTQLAMTSSGDVRLGPRTRLSFPSAPPHHGQFVRGNGEGAFFEGLFLYSRTSFFTCSSVFAVADRPTHRPTEKRTSPSVAWRSRRRSSRAQMSVAARPS